MTYSNFYSNNYCSCALPHLTYSRERINRCRSKQTRISGGAPAQQVRETQVLCMLESDRESEVLCLWPSLIICCPIKKYQVGEGKWRNNPQPPLPLFESLGQVANEPRRQNACYSVFLMHSKRKMFWSVENCGTCAVLNDLAPLQLLPSFSWTACHINLTFRYFFIYQWNKFGGKICNEPLNEF